MTQDDVYRHVGRGGAGNFFNKSTEAETEKDLEAQKPTTAAPTQTPVSHPARAGRGGAGNYAESASAAAEQERTVAQETAKAVKAQPQKSGGGYSGRGGAGNWKTKEEKKDAEEGEEEKGRLEEMEREARETVDQGLKMPEKVVHAGDRKKGLGLGGMEN